MYIGSSLDVDVPRGAELSLGMNYSEARAVLRQRNGEIRMVLKELFMHVARPPLSVNEVAAGRGTRGCRRCLKARRSGPHERPHGGAAADNHAG